MSVLNKLSAAVYTILNQPLSVLRFGLAILLGKKTIEQLYFIYDVTDNGSYALSKTWFTSVLPPSFFDFSPGYFKILVIVIAVVAITAAVGFLGRLNLLFLAFFSFYIFGVSEGIGIFDHHASLPTQVILALALVPGSMKLSIDYALLKYGFFKGKMPFPHVSNNPKWGFNLILALVAVTYFTAGISKLRYGHGLNWLDGQTLGFYLKEKTYLYKEGDVQLIIGDSNLPDDHKWKDALGFIGHTYANYQVSPKLRAIAGYVANNRVLLIALSVGSVLFELLAFVVFINSRYRNIYLISAIVFHLSIGALMGISFRQYRFICFCLMDWNLIATYLSKKLQGFKWLGFKKLSTG